MQSNVGNSKTHKAIKYFKALHATLVRIILVQQRKWKEETLFKSWIREKETLGQLIWLFPNI
jgi:hypothetical protein